MRNMNSRDKWLLYLVLSMLLIVAAWMFGARPLKEKSRTLRANIADLQVEYNEKVGILAKKNEYLQKTKDYTEAFDMMMENYPAGIAKENQIQFVIGLERELGTGITSISYSEPSLLYEFTSKPREGEPYTLIESRMELPVTCDYAMWKHLLDYIFTWQDKSIIPSISASYDVTSGKVVSSVSLQQFAVTGGGRTLEEPDVLVPVGTDNIFQSGAPLSYDGRTNAEKIQEIKKDYDCYIMLHGTASDVPAKVIAGQNDEGKIVSQKNETEELSITVVKGEEDIQIVYALGATEKRVTVPDKDQINIYVLSSARSGERDESGVTVKISNQTEKPVRVAVSEDDGSRPRFQVTETAGPVEIIQ